MSPEGLRALFCAAVAIAGPSKVDEPWRRAGMRTHWPTPKRNTTWKRKTRRYSKGRK